MFRQQGRFIWRELLTSEAEAAANFYSNVVGLSMQGTSAEPARHYSLRVADQPVASVIDTIHVSEAKSVLSGWIASIAVEDIDDTVAQVMRLGGAVHEAPHAEGERRVALVEDSQGAVLSLFATDLDDASGEPVGAARIVGWHELYAGNPGAAFSFYSEIFKWQKGPTFAMGDAAHYQVFVVGGQSVGGMTRPPPGVFKSQWSPFFECGDIDSAKQRVIKGWGSIVEGPREVPGGHWTLKCRDPQGVMFALSGHRT